MSALRRRLFLASRWVAIVFIVALVIEQFRSFYRTDTLCIFPVAFVTAGGSLYLTSDTYSWYTFASEDAADGDDSGPGSLPWVVQRVPQAQWASEMTLGFDAFFGDTSFVIKLPIPFVLPLPALYLLWWRARRRDFQRTHYLTCPTCGYTLSSVVLRRCPECGVAVFSRVTEALPARDGRHGTVLPIGNRQSALG